jgi:hypothetical protein
MRGNAEEIKGAVVCQIPRVEDCESRIQRRNRDGKPE